MEYVKFFDSGDIRIIFDRIEVNKTNDIINEIHVFNDNRLVAFIPNKLIEVDRIFEAGNSKVIIFKYKK